MSTFAHVKASKVVAWGLSPADLRKHAAFRRTSLPKSDKQFADPSFSLEDFGFFKVVTSPQPAFDAAEFSVREVAPTLQAGAWTQTWELVPLTPEQKVDVAASQQAEAKALALDAKVRDDLVLKNLAGMSAAEYETWFDANITNAAQAIGLLKRLTRLALRRLM